MSFKGISLVVAVFIVLGATGYGQVLPLQRTGSLIVGETSLDEIYRFTDFNLDGDFNDDYEIILFYDAVELGNPIHVTLDKRGFIYFVDTTPDIVMRLIDLDGDGDAMDFDESNIYIDNNNASGVIFSGVQGICCDTDVNSTMYLVNPGSGGVNDFVAKAVDLDGNGDCQGFDEIDVLYDSVEAENLGVSIILGSPGACALDSDGYLYVSDYNDPFGEDAIVKMKDLNGDGDMYDADEVAYFYNDGLADYDMSFADAMSFNRDGYLVVNDGVLDAIFFCKDLNSDGDVNDPQEVIEYRNGKSHSSSCPYSAHGLAIAGENDLHWDVYVSEGGTTSIPIEDGLHGFRDKNGDMVADQPDEWLQVYNDLEGDIELSNPKGMTFMKGATHSRYGNAVIGGSVDFVVDGTAYNKVAFIIGATNVPGGHKIRYYGLIEVYPDIITPFYPLDDEGQITVTWDIDNDPGLIGLTIYTQALEGDDYYVNFTNSVTTTVQ